MQLFHSKRPNIATSQRAKLRSPLPRTWSRIRYESILFIRGIGLGIVVTSFQGFFGSNFLEPEKVAIRQNRITALLRASIHAVPVGVALLEIVFNIQGRFVGTDFDKQNYLQFAAKAHEIAIQASLAAILLSYIRYEISAGKGMPFGAVLGGLRFLEVSYLWSVELWSSILSRDLHLRKKFGFVVLILICITVAATAGPSSANLIIPRQGLGLTHSTFLAVNASVLDIWPDQLNDENIETDCSMITPGSFNYTSLCPLSDLYSIFTTNPSDTFIGDERVQVWQIGLPNEGYYLSTATRDQLYGTLSQPQIDDGFGWAGVNEFTTSEASSKGYHFMEQNYYQPYTIASCVADIVRDASDQAPLRFARISETDSELKKDREIVSIPGLTKGQIIKSSSGKNSDFRVHWIELPMDIFNTGIPGVVIMNPQDTADLSYNITTCTLNAGWGSSALASSREDPDDIYSHMSNIPSSLRSGRFEIDSNGYMFVDPPNFAKISNFSYPQRRIDVSKNWMESLNPTVVLAENSTAKFIPLAFSALQSASTEPFQITETVVTRVLNLLLTFTIANTGTEYDWEVFSDLKNATTTCDTCTVFEIKHSTYGWLYSARGATIKLALIVMFAYCTLVLGHIIYSAISGVSSTAWDSPAELVALAMNSSPTDALQNTCAGIVGRQGFQTNVRVLATTQRHLELVFGEPKDPNAPPSDLVLNEKYGRLADEDDHEDEEPESNTQGTLRKRAAAQG